MMTVPPAPGFKITSPPMPACRIASRIKKKAGIYWTYHEKFIDLHQTLQYHQLQM